MHYIFPKYQNVVSISTDTSPPVRLRTSRNTQCNQHALKKKIKPSRHKSSDPIEFNIWKSMYFIFHSTQHSNNWLSPDKPPAHFHNSYKYSSLPKWIMP